MIVGVDPGTTVAWACVSLKGEVLGVGSQRGLDLDGILSNSISYGRAFVVGCDKVKVPSLVHSFAAKFRAKIVSPSYDLLVDEKREMIKGLSVGNAHEADALASALFAYRKTLPLLRRIEKALDKVNRKDLFERVAEIVIKEDMSIRAAIVLCEDKPVVESVESEEEERDVDLVRLFSLLSRERRAFVQAKELNSRLEKEIKKLRYENDLLRERQKDLVKPKSKEKRITEKNSAIQSFADRLNHAKRELDFARKQISFLERALLNREVIGIPKLARFSLEEAEKIRPFVDDTVYVEKIDSFSEKASDLLSSAGVRIVLCGQRPSDKLRKNLPFLFREFSTDSKGKVVLVEKRFLDVIRKEKDALLKVIEDYKKERFSV